ncbi:MAG: hypothetical protein M9924_05485 [Rhizobiaceae bacterium]|nr:hypothetical protein [Rhizobiaceae bacterium]
MTSFAFSAAGVSVAVDLSVGHIADFAIEEGERMLRPLHRAPWIGEKGLPADIAPGLERLSGDFLCAPFSRSDVEEAPGHGWSANSPWIVTSSSAIPGGWRATLELVRPVLGATIRKTLTLRDNHPFLYQEHSIEGGLGELPVSHHAMSIMARGGTLAFSPKKYAETPDTPLEPDAARGRSMLAYPARSEELHRFPTRDGGATDLARYRAGDLREDFLTLVEQPENALGWTALSRAAEGDLVLVLKNPRELPVTMLWYSNGGRQYAPWNGRHLGVLGIEDGRTAVGHRASIEENSLKAEGIPTSFRLTPEGTVKFRHVIGALPIQALPQSVELVEDGLELTIEGVRTTAPFDTKFLQGV